MQLKASILQGLFSWKDLLQWQPLISGGKDRRLTSNLVQSILREKYKGVLVYHACRPEDVSAYYRDGLRIASHASLDCRAKQIFLTDEFPEVTEAILQEAAKEVGAIDDQLSYVSIDDRGFLEQSGQYLIYGSERILAIAACLRRKTHHVYSEVLKRVGKPTILLLSLDWTAIEKDDLDGLVEVIKENYQKAKRGKPIPRTECSFCLFKDIPARNVLDHYHPIAIVDPIQNMATYVYEEPAA